MQRNNIGIEEVSEEKLNIFLCNNLHENCRIVFILLRRLDINLTIILHSE